MSKIVKISIIAIILLLLLTVGVNATTNDTLADELYELGSPYGLSATDKVKIERYLSDYPVTDSEAEALIGYANQVIAIFESAGVTNYADLTTAQKDQIKSIANEAASLIDVTIVYHVNYVEIYKDGKLIETIYETNGKLSYTGNTETTTNTGIIVATILGIAVVGTVAVIAGKRYANA